jgi:hypothetical protein
MESMVWIKKVYTYWQNMHSLTINHDFRDVEVLQKSYTITVYQLCWVRRQDDQQFYSMSNMEMDKKLFLTWTWQFSTSFPSQLHVVSESLGNLWFILVCNLLKGLVIYLVCVDLWEVHVSEKQVTCRDIKYCNWKPSVRSVIWVSYTITQNWICYFINWWWQVLRITKHFTK